MNQLRDLFLRLTLTQRIILAAVTISVIGGLAFALLLSLVVTPTIYAMARRPPG